MRKKWAIVTSLLLVVFVGLVILFHNQLNQLRTLATLRKVDDYPFYAMEYYADYDFESFLKEGIQTDNPLQSYSRQKNIRWACTCFSASNKEGGLILGRNFDWYIHPTLILFTDPPDGYASVSMVDISYLGYDVKDYRGDNIKEPSWIDRKRLLDAPYLPFDGMNEHGVAVGMMAVPFARASEDPQKVTIGGLQAIRLILDYAKDVDEAISLLRNYNIDFGGGPPLHYLVSDSSGNSAVIEFIDGEMNIIRNSEPWQVATNFVISNAVPEGAESACWRYNRAYETLEQADGNVSQEEAMTLLKNVSQPSTIWSVVYNITTGEIQVAMGRKYDKAHRFELEMEIELDK